MIFYYNSIKTMTQRVLPPETVEEVRVFLEKEGFNMTMNCGQTQDMLLKFRDKNGESLMIHQLEPIFVFLCRFGRVWRKDE